MQSLHYNKVYPMMFKTAKVIPKNTERADLSNSRPISLLSVFFKTSSSFDTSGKTGKEIEVTLQKSLDEVSDRQNYQRPPLRLILDISSKTVVQVKEHRVLGITTDDEFKSQLHVSYISKTVSKYLLNVTTEAVVTVSIVRTFCPISTFHQQCGMAEVKLI